ncbi:hypothetical protein GCM10010358_59200 [Streptomyces minutiscleroticus]|uniref:Uncharacterized protein n=1 Tax=Streptomyces minutiscleroticus TaxID=68238 RepID=A0A918U5I9_9ACTN|nr:hypothetical protein GCM10010358_59200 [Streptomyces minutiscleroticus]
MSTRRGPDGVTRPRRAARAPGVRNPPVRPGRRADCVAVGGAEERLPAAAVLGLLAARALHDAEECATAPGRLRRNTPVLRARHPAVPQGVWRRLARGRPAVAAAPGRRLRHLTAAMTIRSATGFIPSPLASVAFTE